MPASICYAVPLGVRLAGCTPVFADADPVTGDVGVSEVAAAAAGRSPGALVAVSGLYGAAAPLARLAEWCETQGVILIEDASLAAGAEIDGRPAGSWGELAFVSTGNGKIVDVGDGALLLLDDPSLAAELVRLASELPPHLPKLDEGRAELSLRYRELQWAGRRDPRAAKLQLGLFDEYRDAFLYGVPPGLDDSLARNLGELPARLERRQAIASVYAEALAGLRLLTPPAPAAKWRFSVLVEERDTVLKRLWDAGEDASAWYPSIPRAFDDEGSYPGAEEIDRSVLNLWLDGRDEASAHRTAALLLDALA